MSHPRIRSVVLAALTLVLASPSVRAEQARTAYDFSFTSIEGEPLPLERFKGKALLVVNTASLCGFTPQYEDLQALWETYRDKGLVVIGVPSGDFGGQEYDSAERTRDFCDANYRITFLLTEKVHVSGEEAHPFFAWVTGELGSLSVPRWNFYKYVIDPEGRTRGLVLFDDHSPVEPGG